MREVPLVAECLAVLRVGGQQQSTGAMTYLAEGSGTFWKGSYLELCPNSYSPIRIAPQRSKREEACRCE